jgi:hypothetical protein
MKPVKTIAGTLGAIAGTLAGGRPSRFRATVTAVVAGGAVAVNVYRGLRNS